MNNMKCQFIKISWGIVEIGNTRVYVELWLTTRSMTLKVKFKVPKGMSYSYVCSAKDAPFEDGHFLSYWIPKNVYFPVHFCGEGASLLVETVVKHLQLEFFNESRKWLTKDEKTTAELLAMKCVSRDDLKWMLNYGVCYIPQVFWDYAEAYGKEYDDYLTRKKKEEREMSEKLNTPEGLAYMLRIARMYGEHRPAVSFIKEFFDK